MGLDWNPANKPKRGCEVEYLKLFHLLEDDSRPEIEKERARFSEITISAYETLNAPRVGLDAVATEWATKKHAELNSGESLEECLEGLNGFYVVELLPPCDGLPRYTNGYAGNYVEAFSFRAQFLADCTEIIGEEMFKDAHKDKLVPAFKKYSADLLEKANAYMAQHGLQAPAQPPEDPASALFHLDVVLCASRWCKFWAERGHPLEAYY